MIVNVTKISQENEKNLIECRKKYYRIRKDRLLYL